MRNYLASPTANAVRGERPTTSEPDYSIADIQKGATG